MTPSSQQSPRVRKIYELRPYPPPARALSIAQPAPVPPEWIRAVCGTPAPRRILVAGCGSGQEAFSLRRAFPKAGIVAMDFSPRSIAIAKELQQRQPSLRDIRFLLGDLTSRGLRAKAGGDFDLISCHGVLSYFPRPESVLDNLARCLAARGVLYLGVNGAHHVSVALREALPRLGFDMAELNDGPVLRKALKLCDEFRGNQGSDRWAKFLPELLAGDVFGPVIQNLSLAEWVARAGSAGWHFQASYHAQREMRPIWQGAIGAQLIPQSRAEVCLFAGALQKHGFHRLLFTRQPMPSPPWDDHEALLDWKPARTALYAARLPRAIRGSCHVTFKSEAFNTRIDWKIPAWGAQILRRSDGRRSLREILAGARPSRQILRGPLYRLYQLMALNFTPPD